MVHHQQNPPAHRHLAANQAIVAAPHPLPAAAALPHHIHFSRSRNRGPY